MRARGERAAKGRRLGLALASILYPLAAYAGIAQLGLAGGAALALKLYPALVNLWLLAVFAYSLAKPPTAIERLARLAEPRLDTAGVRYTRWVTCVWCVFFLVNGGIALATVAMSDEAWLVYNGCIAYLAMGALFAGELAFRRHYRKP